MLFLFQGCLRLSFKEWIGFTGHVVNNGLDASIYWVSD
jgi:hypothetical protein